jgi:hypothetical protein
MIYAIYNQFKKEYVAFFSSKEKAVNYTDRLFDQGIDGYSLVFVNDYKIVEIQLDPEELKR